MTREEHLRLLQRPSFLTKDFAKRHNISIEEITPEFVEKVYEENRKKSPMYSSINTEPSKEEAKKQVMEFVKKYSKI